MKEKGYIMSTIEKNKQPKELEISSANELIYLMDIYEREWEHRNNLFWRQVYRLFYISLIVMVIPIINNRVGINLPKSISAIFFYVIGIAVANFSFFMSLSYAERLKASARTYEKVMRSLPSEYRRISINNLDNTKWRRNGKSVFNFTQTKVIPIVLYILLLLVGIILIVVELKTTSLIIQTP